MNNEKLTKSAEKVLKFMKKHENSGQLIITQNSLANALKCSRMTINRALHQLSEIGYVSMLSGKEGGVPNSYTLNLSVVLKAERGHVAIPKKVECVVYPLDKLNKSIWHGLKSETYSVKVEKQGSREEILVTLALRFHGEPLNAFDKRVYLAICALYNAGNEYMSAGMIYRTMGGNGRPNTKKFEKIKQSIIKMAMVHISIDNAEEANKYKYPRFREVGANLLTCEYESETEIKTRKTEYCLHLLSKPLLMRYAEEHKQVTTYTLEQFQMPLSMTELNCAMDDYFRHRIARASGNTLKIKYKSLLEHCYLTDKYARRKAKEKIPVFLDFYVKLGLIHGYSLETTEISINL